MNSFKKEFRNFFNNIYNSNCNCNCNYNNNQCGCNFCNKQQKLMKMYYNLYNTGCGIDLFVKGCNIKKMMCIINSLKK